MRAAKLKPHFVPCYSSCNKKREAAQLVQGVKRVLVPRCTPGASSQQPWGPQSLSDGGGGGGFSSPDLLLGAAGGQDHKARARHTARGSSEESGSRTEQQAGRQAATWQPSPGCALPRRCSIARCLNRHFFLSSEPAQPRLGHPPPPHPTPSKLPCRKAAERQGRVFQGRGREKSCPSSRLAAVLHCCTTARSHHVPSPSSFLLYRLPPATCLQGTIFCNLSATPEPLASSHNLGCHFL